MASIQSSLFESPSPQAECAIVKQFWSKDVSPQDQVEGYKPYFRYYDTECRRLRIGISKEAWQATTIVATRHEDILHIVHILSLERTSKRSDIRVALRQHYEGDDTALNRSIDFALRLWLTLNVREERYGLQTPRTPTIQWDNSSTLLDFIARNFPQATTSTIASNLPPLDHTFTAANINRLSGIDIEWTPCLADHLRFDKRRRLLRVYPFKQILLDQLQQGPSSIIPTSVLKETLLSLNLLFPHWDPLTDNFMLSHDQKFHLESFSDDSGPHSLADYYHWRNRLLELHQIFHSPPVTWPQIWADRRNPLQWYTFWVAIVILVLTIIFGVISSVTSIMQTYLAVESIRLARAPQVASN